MKTIPLSLAFSLLAVSLSAQPDTTLGWKHSLISGLTLTQVSYTDWAQGGENALAYTASIDGKTEDDELRTNWTTTYKFAFGQARLGGKGLRKTDDKIDFESVLLYKIGVYVNPYIAGTFKTQFAEGFKYNEDGTKTAVSNMLDPAYATQSVGAGYEPVKQFKTRLGVAVREIFADAFAAIYSDDPATPELEKTRIQGGLESVSELDSKLDEDILVKSKLELFAPFDALDVIVVRMDNALVVSVNKFLNVNFNVQIINERAVSPRTQIKETLALGFTYKLL